MVQIQPIGERVKGFILGLWLLFAPATFGYTSQALIYSDLASGVLLLLLSLSPKSTWGYALIGCWLGFAPLLFWAPEPACYLNDTLVGMLSLALFIVPKEPTEEGPSVPKGWSYNPSSWPQRLPIALLAFLGWMFSRYMGAYQLGYIDTIWDPFFGDGTLNVITSTVSKQFPIPDAGFGAFAYSLEMLSVLKGGERRWRTMPWMVIVFGLLAIPLSLTSIILIILQPLVVGAWCTLCLGTALCMLLLMALSIDEVAAVIQYLRSKEKPFLKLLFQGGESRGATYDQRTPPLDAPLLSLVRASFWGVTLPWNIALSILTGAFFMFAPGLFEFDRPMANVDHVFGALIIVISFIAMAEQTRKARFINVLFAAIILIASLVTFQGLVLHIPLALLTAILAIPSK